MVSESERFSFLFSWCVQFSATIIQMNFKMPLSICIGDTFQFHGYSYMVDTFSVLCEKHQLYRTPFWSCWSKTEFTDSFVLIYIYIYNRYINFIWCFHNDILYTLSGFPTTYNCSKQLSELIIDILKYIIFECRLFLSTNTLTVGTTEEKLSTENINCEKIHRKYIKVWII